MRLVRPVVSRSLKADRGFTMVELMVGILVGGIIAAAGFTFVVVTSRQYESQQDRVYATDDARNAQLKMVTELRDATSVRLVDQRTVDATVRATDGSLEDIRFTCAATTNGLSECTRTLAGSTDAKLLVTGVLNEDNFSIVSGSDLTGTSSLNGALRIDFDMKLSGVTNPQNPINIVSTVKPRNCVASPAPGVLNPTC